MVKKKRLKWIFSFAFMILGLLCSPSISSLAAEEGAIAGEENILYEVSSGYEYVVNKSGLYAFSLKGTNGATFTCHVSNHVVGSSSVTGYGGTGGYGVGYIKVKKGDIISFIKNGRNSVLYHNGQIVATATGATDGSAWQSCVRSDEKEGCTNWGTCQNSCGADGTHNCYGYSPNCDDTACCVGSCGEPYSCCRGSTYTYYENYYQGYSTNGISGHMVFGTGGWHNAKFTNIEGSAKSGTTIVDAPKLAEGTIDMPLSETSAYIVNVHGSYPIQYELNGGYFPNDTYLAEGDIDDWSKVVNPVRPGFKFTGWDVVSGMDDNTHSIKKADGTVYTTNATSLDYKTFTKDYIYILNLNESGDPVKFVAHWIDSGDDDINKPDVFDSLGNKGNVTFRNTNDGLNSDSGLRVLSSLSPSNYSIERVDGTKDILKNVAMSETYSNKHSGKTTSLRTSKDPLIYDLDPVNYYQYPNVFGQTLDNQLYYTGTWTNKSVTVYADAWDGYRDEFKVNPTRVGGSGIEKMRFNNEGWVTNPNPIPDQNKMTITKTYSGRPGKVTVYKTDQTVTIIDRADKGNSQVGSAWDPSSKANETTRKYIDSSKKNTWIKIDMQAPAIMNPEDYIGTTEYAKRYAQMYEGYNLLSSSDEKNGYGWAKDNVRIVIYATDGDGSGIVNQAFCWVPDGSGIDYHNDANWQSADSTRTYTYSYEDANGNMQTVTKAIPVSTRVIEKNESGYVYVRDAVGNYSSIRYQADHVDKRDPIVYPEKKPTPSDVDNEPLPEDPNNPKDYDDKDPTYTYEKLGTLTYDWVNSDVKISFKARDDEDTRPGYSVSGIYQMRIYAADNSFTKANLLESSYSNSVSWICSKQGITYYVVEVEDRANNITQVNLTVKLDKTAPIIVSTGNNKLDFSIQEINLDDYGIDKVESIIKDTELMKRYFLFNSSDYNNTDNGEMTKKEDSSGIESFVVRLINSSDENDFKDYAFNRVSGTEVNTFEFESSSSIKAILASKYDYKLNTFAEFPNAATLKYQITIVDRAGNKTIYNNKPGNEIKNFSIKAVVHYAGVADEDANVVLSADGSNNNLNILQNDRNGNLITIPYLEAGDFGYIEAWTIGYVPEITFDFGDVGKESAKEILTNKLPRKYNLGITSDLTFTRKISVTKAQEIQTAFPVVNGIPYASHYGVIEEDIVNRSNQNQFANRFRENGTAIRLPIYYKLQADGTKKKDGSDNYTWEVHEATIRALKINGSFSDDSKAMYVIWDTKLTSLHHRITHES